VLVLGGGFLGSHIARDLIMRSYGVVVLTRSQPSGLAAHLLSGAELVIGDAAVHTTLSRVLDGTDYVIFALSSLLPGEADQSARLDMSLTLDPLLELLDQLSNGSAVPVTILSSGGTVYGRATTFPTPEDAPTEPLSAYGITKLTAEKFVLRYSSMSGTPVRVLRIGNAYGPGQSSARGQGVIAAALECCLLGRPFIIFGDGGVARDFVYVDDLAAAVASLVDLTGGDAVVNIGSGTSYRLDDVLEIVGEVTGHKLAVERRAGRTFDLPRVQLDTRRIQSLVDFRPRALRDGILETWKHLTDWAEEPPLGRPRSQMGP
jgi:UDP-glucose 4-epimerase